MQLGGWRSANLQRAGLRQHGLPPELFSPYTVDLHQLTGNDTARNRLFDHLIGEREKRRRNCEAQRSGGFDVDHKLELGQSLDCQLARLGTPEDATDVDSSMTIGFRHTIAV